MATPHEHGIAMQGVLDTLRIVQARPEIDEDELVSALQRQGYSPLQSEKLNAFVPSAFAWAMLKRMGVESFPSHYITFAKSGQEVQLPLAQEHYFSAALLLAYQTLEEGWSDELPRSTFEAVIGRSAEMGAANQALSSGSSLAGCALQSLRVFRFDAEEAGEVDVSTPGSI
jgi:hypothetical protein